MADSTRKTRRRVRSGTDGIEDPSQGVLPNPSAFDRLVHERVRLGILSALAAGGTLSFNHLKQVLETSDGNLSVHARRLEEAGYIESVKSFEDRMPKTEYRLTATGRTALGNYLDQMEQIIRITRS